MENTEIVHALSLILMITDKLFCLIFFFLFPSTEEVYKACAGFA